MSALTTAIRIRRLHPEDIPAWVTLINTADAVDQLGRTTDVETMKARLDLPGYGPEHVLLAWRRRRLVGYADLLVLSQERAIGNVTVHPYFRQQGIGRVLLRRLCALARRCGVRHVDVPVLPRIKAARALLTRSGFYLARVWLEMWWVSIAPPPAPEPPPGVRLRTYRPEQDAGAWAALAINAFAGHWEATPLSLEDIAAIICLPDFDPGGFWLAEVDGQLVGQALARYNAHVPALGGIPLGRIEDVAVLPEYRGRGIGRALVLAAMRYLWQQGCRTMELTVDARNTQAIRLYRTLGFIEAGQLHWYRLDLESSRSKRRGRPRRAESPER